MCDTKSLHGQQHVGQSAAEVNPMRVNAPLVHTVSTALSCRHANGQSPYKTTSVQLSPSIGDSLTGCLSSNIAADIAK